MIGRGRVTSTNDEGPVQFAQVRLSQSELRDNTPRISEYGLQSNPPDGTDVVLLFAAGDRTNGIVIACGNQKYRFRGLDTGEVALSDDKGQSVHLSKNGIVLTDKSGSVVSMNGDGTGTATFAGGLTINAKTKIVGDLEVTGDIKGDKSIKAANDIADQGGSKTMAAMRSAYGGHTHTDSRGGTTSNPNPSM